MFTLPQNLNVETEFDLMVNYQIAIESKSVIVENDLRDKHRYSLVAVEEPFPSYEEYLNGDDFEETKIIRSSSSYDELRMIQDERRKK